MEPITSITPRQLGEAWVENLRSGTFEQGYGRLYCPRSQSYCCLGVLVETAITLCPELAEWQFLWEEFGTIGRDTTAFLPHTLQEFLSVDRDGSPEDREEHRYQLANGERSLLTIANDCFGQSFAQIADIIEEQLLPYLEA